MAVPTKEQLLAAYQAMGNMWDHGARFIPITRRKTLASQKEIEVMTNDNTTDFASAQPWNDFKDTPEAREAVTKIQAHYTPIVVGLRQDIADRDSEIKDQKEEIEGHKRTISMQRMFMVGLAVMSVYLVVFH